MREHPALIVFLVLLGPAAAAWAAFALVPTPPMTWWRRRAERCRDKGRFKVLHDRDSVSRPYITRYNVFKSPVASVFLHQIHRSDDAADLHDHPWPFFHRILEGEYIEEVRLPGRFGPRACLRGPGFWAFRRASYAHRIELFTKVEFGSDGQIIDVPDEVWTLVVTGPKVRDWGFVGRLTGCWTAWSDYVYAGFRCE